MIIKVAIDAFQLVLQTLQDVWLAQTEKIMPGLLLLDEDVVEFLMLCDWKIIPPRHNKIIFTILE